MKLVEWGAGHIGDDDHDGNVDISISGVRVFGFFRVPDIKVELPTSVVIEAGRTLVKNLPLPAPFAAFVDVADRLLTGNKK